jgi:hypothetical protein
MDRLLQLTKQGLNIYLLLGQKHFKKQSCTYLCVWDLKLCVCNCFKQEYVPAADIHRNTYQTTTGYDAFFSFKMHRAEHQFHGEKMPLTKYKDKLWKLTYLQASSETSSSGASGRTCVSE